MEKADKISNLLVDSSLDWIVGLYSHQEIAWNQSRAWNNDRSSTATDSLTNIL